MRASRTSAALAGRFDGSFSSRRRISASSAGGQSGRCQDGATGGVFRCWPMIATRLVADEGRPAADHLVEHRAEAVEVAARRDLAAHRLLRRHVVDTVPTIMPAWVSRERSTATARPKSPIIARPSSASQTLPGLRSRWTMPLEWANSRP